MSDEKKGGKVIRVNFKENLIGVEPDSQNPTAHQTNNERYFAKAVVTAVTPIIMAGPSAAFLDNSNHNGKVNGNDEATSHVRQLTSPPPHMKLPCDIIREFADRKLLKGDTHACQIDQEEDSNRQR